MYSETQQSMNAHPELTISLSSKGKLTTIIYYNEYNDSVGTMLEAENTYKQITKDHTHKYQNKANTLINNLKNSQSMSDVTAKQLKRSSSIATSLYCFRKINKKDIISFRPIVSCICI